MGAHDETLSLRFRAERNISILTWDGDMEWSREAEIYMTGMCKQCLGVTWNLFAQHITCKVI